MQGVLGDAEEQGVGQGPGAGALDPEVTDLSGLLSFGRRSAGIVQGSPESSFTSQNSALPLRASSSRGGAGAGPLLNQPASDSLPASLTFWQQGTSQRPVMVSGNAERSACVHPAGRVRVCVSQRFLACTALHCLLSA